jgi:hypothetical protein
MTRDNDRLFAGWKPTETPSDLGTRVVAAARRADREIRPVALVDRIWHSRGLKLGWLAATAALLVLNVWMPSPAAPGSPGRYAAGSRDGEQVEAAGRMDIEERARWSDQQMLLCKVLDDCDQTPHQDLEVRPSGKEDNGGKA